MDGCQLCTDIPLKKGTNDQMARDTIAYIKMYIFKTVKIKITKNVFYTFSAYLEANVY